MKSYLSLIPISARVRRQQNRMTLLCIFFAVFLVTAVFSMAEMGVRMEQSRLSDKQNALTFQDILNSEMGQSLFLAAAVLFVLILIAGVLMISGSINANVAQRTRFFGMMRCIGMSRRQIIRFVRLEALNWCKTAIPAGVLLGILSSWGLCAALRFLVGEEFTSIPLFGVSAAGIVSGVAMGTVTVMLAARSPARRAARVSPVTAVSGNADSGRTALPEKTRRHPSAVLPEGLRTRNHAVPAQRRHGRSVCPGVFRIELFLGIRHALSARKNLILMTSSFALSILLFLCFTVLIDFVGCLMPQSAAASDIDISSADGTNSIDSGLAGVLGSMDGVKHVYGRRSALDLSAQLNSGGTLLFCTADLVSFDDFDLECLKKDRVLKRGSDLSKIYGDSGCVLAAWDPYSSWEIGDTVKIGEEELEIAGLLNYDPFSSDGLTHGSLTLIASGETFARLTGTTGYSLLMIQTTADADDEDVAALRAAAGSEYTFQDKRGQRTAGTYLAFVLCVYAFLAIIILVSVLNIINSISMSVSSRIRQYGSMRAVGMDTRQLAAMIAAEAFTYALGGCALGCLVGLPLNKLLYQLLITAHFPYAVWQFPAASLLLILGVIFLATAAAAWLPTRRVKRLSVTETITFL